MCTCFPLTWQLSLIRSKIQGDDHNSFRKSVNTLLSLVKQLDGKGIENIPPETTADLATSFEQMLQKISQFSHDPFVKEILQTILHKVNTCNYFTKGWVLERVRNFLNSEDRMKSRREKCTSIDTLYTDMAKQILQPDVTKVYWNGVVHCVDDLHNRNCLVQIILIRHILSTGCAAEYVMNRHWHVIEAVLDSSCGKEKISSLLKAWVYEEPPKYHSTQYLINTVTRSALSRFEIVLETLVHLETQKLTLEHFVEIWFIVRNADVIDNIDTTRIFHVQSHKNAPLAKNIQRATDIVCYFITSNAIEDVHREEMILVLSYLASAWHGCLPALPPNIWDIITYFDNRFTREISMLRMRYNRPPTVTYDDVTTFSPCTIHEN